MWEVPWIVSGHKSWTQIINGIFFKRDKSIAGMADVTGEVW